MSLIPREGDTNSKALILPQVPNFEGEMPDIVALANEQLRLSEAFRQAGEFAKNRIAKWVRYFNRINGSNHYELTCETSRLEINKLPPIVRNFLGSSDSYKLTYTNHSSDTARVEILNLKNRNSFSFFADLNDNLYKFDENDEEWSLIPFSYGFTWSPRKNKDLAYEDLLGVYDDLYAKGALVAIGFQIACPHIANHLRGQALNAPKKK